MERCLSESLMKRHPAEGDNVCAHTCLAFPQMPYTRQSVPLCLSSDICNIFALQISHCLCIIWVLQVYQACAESPIIYISVMAERQVSLLG